MGTATPGDFKKAKYSTLKIPSGNEIVAKRVSIEEWISAGEVPNALKPVLAKALEGKVPTQKDILGGADTPSEKLLQELMQMYDFAVTKIFVRPPCFPVPSNEIDRDPEKLYADEVGSEDKAFLFHWSTGGANDVERFRKEAAEALGSLEKGEDVAETAVGASGDQ